MTSGEHGGRGPADVRLRTAGPTDLDRVLAVHRAGFGSELEPELARSILASGRSRPDWSVLAVDEHDAAIGHVLVSYVDVELDTGGACEVPLLSPVSVVPAWQRQGVGGALVREAQRRTRTAGEELLVVEGDWRYYERFDFTTAEDLGLRRPGEGIPRRCFMLARLHRDAEVPQGRLVYPPPFHVVEGP